ncbi:unnamed protein product [Allacma fusca]|uniref:Sugar transporter SWEET n=1 Tax=Allacma fusca TaxID=39272 RepID=A0A8J2Q6H7_9HEXA|nr:unnamed protein product [Allacma fusca]
MSFKDCLIISATTTTICQFLSGSFTALKVKRMGSPGDLSPVPFLSAVVGCCLWLFYGTAIEDNTIIYTNIVGVTLNFLYVAVFLLYSSKRTGLVRQSFCAFAFLAFVVYYIESLPEPADQKNNLGLLCVVVSLLCCASPLIALKIVIQTKSTETLPFPLILSMFLVCFQWWLYGVLIEDFYMQTTNVLGTFIALAQLSLFIIYRSSVTKGLSSPPLYTSLRSPS